MMNVDQICQPIYDAHDQRVKKSTTCKVQQCKPRWVAELVTEAQDKDCMFK